jgi:hypothetical protein
MSRILPLFPFAAALSLLACQNDGPVADNLATPPEGLVGDQSASGLAKPGNAGAAEAVDRAALPPMTGGMAWLLSDDGRAAHFGPVGAEPVLTFACGSPGLIVTRHDNASPGTAATVSFTGSGHAASIPVAAVPTSVGPGQAEWQGRASGDNARAIQRSFASTGQVEVSIGGAPSLVVPAGRAIRRLLSDCIS